MLIGVILLLALGASAAAYLGKRYADAYQASVVAALHTGQNELEAGKAASKKAASSQSPADLEAAGTHFAGGRRAFARAKTIAHGDPLLAAVDRFKPAADYIDPRLRAVDGVADMGIAMSVAGDDAIALQSILLSQRPGQSSGQRLIAALTESGPAIARLKADFQTGEVAANTVDLRYVPSGQRAAFASAHATISQGLATLTELQTLTPALLEILGANGPRTYLVEQVNPGELRGGGGFIGTYSVLSANGGTLSMRQGGDITALDYPRPNKGQRGYVAPPATTVDFYGNKSWVLGDSNLAADFPTNAKQGLFFLQKEAGIKADGVIAIDPQVISYLLEVTGPIAVPGFNVTVQAPTFVDQVFQIEDAAIRQPGRKNFLTELAQPLLDKVSNLPSSKWSDLVTELNLAAARRDLQAYFVNQTAQDEMTRIGWAADLNTSRAPDFMMEVENNFGGDKANHWVARSYDVALSAQGGQLHHAVKVNITDSAPINAYGGSLYRFYVRFYFPLNGSGTIGGVKADVYPTDEKPANLKMVDGWQQVNVPASGKGTTTVTFSYDTPLSDLASGHDIYWQKQPGTVADKINVTWTDGAHSYQAAGDLLQDRVIRVTPTGVSLLPGQAGSAKLPSFSL